MTFRNANLSDAASLAAISMEVWVGTYLRKGVSNVFADYALREFTAARFQSALESDRDHIIVSQNTDGIDGFIRLSLDSEAPIDACSGLEIKTLYVQPRHHGRGIGKGLLKAGFDRCAQLGIQSAWLTVNAENTAARDFYLALDFRIIGQTHFRIGDQAYPNDVMQRKLT